MVKACPSCFMKFRIRTNKNGLGSSHHIWRGDGRRIRTTDLYRFLGSEIDYMIHPMGHLGPLDADGNEVSWVKEGTPITFLSFRAMYQRHCRRARIKL